MQRIRPVFKCHGGKFFISDFIISHFPKNYANYRFCEPCGGAASVLLSKDRSTEEIYNDIDPKIAAIFIALTSYPSSFISKVQSIPYEEKSFEKARNNRYEDGAINELVKRRMSRGGLGKHFSWSERLRGGQPGDKNAWDTFKEHLPVIAERLKGVQIHCTSVLNLLKSQDSPDMLWYIDPPYLKKTRVSPDAYNVEMSEQDHIDLGNALQNVKGKVILSGYQSDLYNKLYKGWNMDCIVVANHSGQTKVKQKRVECVWTNF